MSVFEQDKQQWKVEVTVIPAVEWEKLGLGPIEVDPDTTVTFERQVEGGSLLYVILLSTSGHEELHRRV